MTTTVDKLRKAEAERDKAIAEVKSIKEANAEKIGYLEKKLQITIQQNNQMLALNHSKSNSVDASTNDKINLKTEINSLGISPSNNDDCIKEYSDFNINPISTSVSGFPHTTGNGIEAKGIIANNHGPN